MYLWAAVDVDTHEILGTWANGGRSGLEALSFVKSVLGNCRGGSPSLRGHGTVYQWSLERLGLPREHRTFGPRNPIEGWFGIYKGRTRRFYRRWPHNASLDQVDAWTKVCVSCDHVKTAWALS